MRDRSAVAENTTEQKVTAEREAPTKTVRSLVENRTEALSLLRALQFALDDQTVSVKGIPRLDRGEQEAAEEIGIRLVEAMNSGEYDR